MADRRRNARIEADDNDPALMPDWERRPPVRASTSPERWVGYREAGMACGVPPEHASGIATATAPGLDHEQAQAAFELERLARSLLADRMHYGLVQNVAAALLLLATV